MRAILLAIALLGCLYASLEATAQEPSLIGQWKVVSATRYGDNAKDVVGVIWRFQRGNKFTTRDPNGRSLEGRYQLTKADDPWQIDLETNEDKPEFGGRGPRLGIVTVEGGQLTLCIAGGGGVPRPR